MLSLLNVNATLQLLLVWKTILQTIKTFLTLVRWLQFSCSTVYVYVSQLHLMNIQFSVEIFIVHFTLAFCDFAMPNTKYNKCKTLVLLIKISMNIFVCLFRIFSQVIILITPNMPSQRTQNPEIRKIYFEYVFRAKICGWFFFSFSFIFGRSAWLNKCACNKTFNKILIFDKQQLFQAVRLNGLENGFYLY